MSKDNYYDIAIIGGGISSCVFTSTLIRNGFKGSIAIIEYGRNLGGRSSTRKSFLNKGWQLNHGSPNLNIGNTKNNKLLNSFIQKLLDEDIIQKDDSETIHLEGHYKLYSKLNSQFDKGEIYTSKTSMSELSLKIISYSNLRNQIKYFFETLIIKLKFENNSWLLTSKNGDIFKAKYVICSSNLLLHKRSLNILKTDQIPLRKAIPINLDKKIDLLLSLLKEQDYIQRLTFMFYPNSNYCFKDYYEKKYRYFILNNLLEEKFKFERIIFQKQFDNKLGFVIHTKSIELINEYFQSKNKDIFKKKILNKFNKLFSNHSIINNLLDYQDISIMLWRASQPSGLAIPENLQLCENYNIGFCGDWFDTEGFARIEGAMISALKLAYKINNLI